MIGLGDQACSQEPKRSKMRERKSRSNDKGNVRHLNWRKAAAMRDEDQVPRL